MVILEWVTKVINKYGNMIDEQAKRSLAFDILEDLEDGGFFGIDCFKELNTWRAYLDEKKPKDTLSEIFEEQKKTDANFAENENKMISDLNNRKNEIQENKKAKVAHEIKTGNAIKKEQSKSNSLKNLDSFTDKEPAKAKAKEGK